MKQVFPRLLRSLAEVRDSRIQRGAVEIFLATSASRAETLVVVQMLCDRFSYERSAAR